jgi:hypothetical protein
MNLYTIVMVEPVDKIPAGARAGEDVTLVLGGIPGGETTGPWRDDQRGIIETAVKQWHRQVPEKVTELHKCQREIIRRILDQENYYFTFEFHTGDDIDLDCYFEDTTALFEILKQACEGTDMVPTRFDSI